MKLMIAVPTLDYIHYDFVRCLTGLVRKLDKDGIDFDVSYVGGTLVHISRELIGEEAVKQGYTHVLWLDADMVFEDTLFDKLYAVNKPIVTGVYHGRRPPFTSCIFQKINPPEKVSKYPDELFEVEGCGFGCVLTEVKVIEDVRREYEQAFLPTRYVGEDLAFCERARSLGYKIYCDPSVQCGHIGHLVIWPDFSNRKTEGA